MSLLFVVFIYIITANGQTLIGKGEDIICNTSENGCTIDCTDSNCNQIKIYSSSNDTLINCHSSSCVNINVYCIGNVNKCILSCSYSSCINSTLTCNTNSNNAICECQGDGCPPTLITTNNINTNHNNNVESNNDNNYSVNQSLLVVFFSGFFVIIVCCFCVLVVAICFIGLYFGEKKKQKKQKNMNQMNQQLPDLKTTITTRKISFLSSEPNDIKSEARASYLSWRSHHNTSYDADASVMMSEDEIDDIIMQQTIQNEQTLLDIPEINELEKHNENKEESPSSQRQTEIQQEGISKTKHLSLSISNVNQKHQKFDSEDLYILPGQSTNIGLKIDKNHAKNINEQLKFHTENIDSDDDKMDDIGSDNECIEEMDGDEFQTKPNHMNECDSAQYTLDGHNHNNISNSLKLDLKLVPHSISIENNNLEFDDISVDISAKLPTSPNPAAQIHGLKPHKITKHPPKGVLLRPPTINGEGKKNNSHPKKPEIIPENIEQKEQQKSPIISISRMADYHENNLNALPDGASVGSESTFTIKSAPQSLSRTTSLNSAAAVRVAFPETNNKLNHNIPFGVYHMNKNKSKHRNYYSQQLYFKPNAIRFEGNNKSENNNMKTPPNSNRTQNSINVGTEKPVIINTISKMPSMGIVPSLPISPCDNNYYEQQDIVPPLLLHQRQLSDDSVVQTRKIKKKKAVSERKFRSKSRTTHQSNTSRKNSNDSSQNSMIGKKYRKRSSPKSPPNKKKRKNNKNNEIIIKQKRKIRRNQRQTVPSYGSNDEADKKMVRTVKIKRNVVLPIDNGTFPQSSKSVAMPKLEIPDGLSSNWHARKRIIMTPPPEIHRHKYKNDTFHTAAAVMSSQSMFIKNIIK